MDLGTKGTIIAKFSSGFLLLNVYLNITDDGTSYYDTVLYRKIRSNGHTEYKRGANLKPTDLADAILLLGEAQKFIREQRNCPRQLTGS